MSLNIVVANRELSFVAKKGETVLEAALRQRCGLPYGCQNGVCGSCKGRVLEGRVHYRQEVEALSGQELEEGYALFCQAVPDSDLLIEVGRGVAKHPCRVRVIERLSHDVIRLVLALPKSECLQFLPGQYVDILLDNGKRRSFSLANAPHDADSLELHVRYYQDGLFSEYVFHKLQEQELLYFSGPTGNFFFHSDGSKPIIMVAGGTGFAPIKSIIEHLLYTACDRSVYFYWGARQEKDLYLHELVRSWADQYETFNYVPVLSQLEDVELWSGRRGMVDQAVLADFADLSGYEVYACGPPSMVQAVHDGCIAQGLPAALFYSDPFEFAAD